jgi:hypothetical protein
MQIRQRLAECRGGDVDQAGDLAPLDASTGGCDRDQAANGVLAAATEDDVDAVTIPIPADDR